MRRTSAAWRLPALAAIVVLCAASATGCKKRALPPELIGSYTRSGPGSTDLRAELSVARGGMVLTVVKLSASVDMGAFSTLFAAGNTAGGTGAVSMGASGDVGRTVSSARTFQSLACDRTFCQFELSADGPQPACEGTFEKVGNTIVIVAGGACLPYSGRWVLLEGLPPELPPPSGSTATASSAAPMADGGAGGNATGGGSATKLDFPPDVPTPHDHMSCLEACSIVDTRCHRMASSADRESFLACVEKGQICRARCEQVFPFFGAH